jgi:hypothetical protein
MHLTLKKSKEQPHLSITLIYTIGVPNPSLPATSYSPSKDLCSTFLLYNIVGIFHDVNFTW